MTYSDLVTNLKTVIESHYLINQYGYGNLSDIETPETGTPNYPYAFLRPQDMTIGQYNQTFLFELILMDYCFDNVDSYVDGTSRMLQILTDIIANYRLTSGNLVDIQVTVTATPFKERFKDSVVGITARINVELGEPLDGCNTPFA